MLRLDHGEIQSYSRIDPLFVKSLDDERGILACTLVCRLQVVSKSAAAESLNSGATGIRVDKPLYLVNGSRRYLFAAAVPDYLCYTHSLSLDIRAALGIRHLRVFLPRR